MLKEPVILVTGAGKGIGEAIVVELIKRSSEFSGVKLFITSRTESDLTGLTLLAKGGEVDCHYLASDLAEKPLEAFEACMKVYGRVDVLIHSAGVGRFGHFEDMTGDDVRYVMKTNVEATFLLMQAVYAQMKVQDLTYQNLRGQIQFITSTASETPFEHSSIYCMSKFAQRGLVEVMRMYARKDRIRILEVKPGPTITPMWGEISEDQRAKMMNPKDIATPMIDALKLGANASAESLTLRPITGDL